MGCCFSHDVVKLFLFVLNNSWLNYKTSQNFLGVSSASEDGASWFHKKWRPLGERKSCQTSSFLA